MCAAVQNLIWLQVIFQILGFYIMNIHQENVSPGASVAFITVPGTDYRIGVMSTFFQTPRY